MGASHLRIRTEDIAKLRQLYLQKGRWNGKQLLSPEWWRSPPGKRSRLPETAHGDTLTCHFDGDKLRIQFMFSAHRLENMAEDRRDILETLVATGA
jgi:hypothetical protein